MIIPSQAVDLIKRWEGFEESTYHDPRGIPTIGYVTTAAANLGIVPVPGMTISEKQAERFLVRAVERFAAKIEPHLKRKPNENQWAAMLSLAYNIGPNAFIRSSVMGHFNDEMDMRAADAFLLWDKSRGKVLRGLQRRRQDERTLFLTPVPPKFWSAIWPVLKAIFRKVLKRFPQLVKRSSVFRNLGADYGQE